MAGTRGGSDEAQHIPSGADCGGRYCLAGAGAEAPGETLTFDVPNDGAHLGFVDNPPRARGSSSALTLGDTIDMYRPLFAGGREAGTLYASCEVVKPGRTYGSAVSMCTMVYELKDGSITAQGLRRFGAPASRANVSGGTGAFANAEGTVVSARGEAGWSDVVSLLR